MLAGDDGLQRFARNDGKCGRNDGWCRHSRVGGSPWRERDWIPAYAGMTGSGAGMTAFTSGQRPHFQGEALTFVTARREAMKPPEGSPSPQEHSALPTKSLASSGERHQPFLLDDIVGGCGRGLPICRLDVLHRQ
jgi:hypothetical protein